VDASTYIVLVDATIDWHHGNTQCLLGKDLAGYDFLTVSKDEFVFVSMQSASSARLGDVVLQ
jgi:hypothetical protein